MIIKKVYDEAGKTVVIFDEGVSKNRYTTEKILSKIEECYYKNDFSKVDGWTVAELDEMAVLLKVSDYMDGYWDLKKVDKLEVIRGMV